MEPALPAFTMRSASSARCLGPQQEVPPAVNDLDRPEHTAPQEAASPAPAAR